MAAGLDLAAVAELIRSGACRRLTFLTGAGISVAAGIPDFRSPGGMYDTLRPDLLTASQNERVMMTTDPTAVVSWHLFSHNQLPYLELRRPFILGVREQTWKPTLAHYFIRLCHNHHLLQRLYTQNIDGIDYQLNLPAELVVPVHGSLGQCSCEFCGAASNFDSFAEAVATQIRDIYSEGGPAVSTPIPCPLCGEPGIKPSTVLYGRSLPKDFFDCRAIDMPITDLCFLVGTSLTVGPANSIAYAPRDSCPRVIVNRDAVGHELGLNEGGRDAFLLGDCDAVMLELAEELGWIDELVQTAGGNMAPASRALLEKYLLNRA